MRRGHVTPHVPYCVRPWILGFLSTQVAELITKPTLPWYLTILEFVNFGTLRQGCRNVLIGTHLELHNWCKNEWWIFSKNKYLWNYICNYHINFSNIYYAFSSVSSYFFCYYFVLFIKFWWYFLIFYIFFVKYLFLSLNSNTNHTINEPKIHLIILFDHNITLFTLLFYLNRKKFNQNSHMFR